MHTHMHTHTRRMPQLSVCLSTCLSVFLLSLLQQVKLGRSICCVMSVNMQVGIQAGRQAGIAYNHTTHNTHIHHDAVGIYTRRQNLAVWLSVWLAGWLSICRSVSKSICTPPSLFPFLSSTSADQTSLLCEALSVCLSTQNGQTDRHAEGSRYAGRQDRQAGKQSGSTYRLRRPPGRPPTHTHAHTCIDVGTHDACR